MKRFGFLFAQCTLAAVLIASSATLSFAEPPTDTDARFEVAVPESCSVGRVPKPPKPFSALWMSPDATLRLAVLVLEIEAPVKLDPRGLKAGLLEEVPGNFQWRKTTQQHGIQIYRMQVVSENVRVEQAVFTIGRKIYKVMAATTGGRPLDQCTRDFIGSLQIKPPGNRPLSMD